MESGADSYLHKKFKKQLSLEPKPQPKQQPNQQLQEEQTSSSSSNNERREIGQTNKVPEGARQEEETIGGSPTSLLWRRKDNNEFVPKQSTNQIQSSTPETKSSISLEKCIIATVQSTTNSCISYVVSSSQQAQHNNVNFKTNESSINLSEINKDHLHLQPSQLQQQSQPMIVEETKGPSSTTGAGKYICPYCSLVCSKPSVLQKHIRAHTNERPYPCNSCGFSFKTRSNLYKHCRSRTHANRVMGNKAQEGGENSGGESIAPQQLLGQELAAPDLGTKPYKPRFHTGAKQFFNSLTKENIEQQQQEEGSGGGVGGGGVVKSAASELLSHHINEIINKNNSIVNSTDHHPYILKRRPSDVFIDNNNEYQRQRHELVTYPSSMGGGGAGINNSDEPLNLTKNRKRCMSEIVEPVAQKSLIKELLLKNLNSDMQCPHCKMIFQTVTELELHKLRSCKGFVKPGAKYSRSSSVNVASILTQNKNAFDNIPHLQNVFQLKSPGPFLGKTRLVEADKNKSFSFDDGLSSNNFVERTNERYLLSPLTVQTSGEKDRKVPVKLFGGEVKIAHTSGETKSFKIDSNKDGEYTEYTGKLSENRVVKSTTLQSGGTVLTNKTNYNSKQEIGNAQDVIRVYENSAVSPSIDLDKSKFPFEQNERNGYDLIGTNTKQARMKGSPSPSYKYQNIVDFSQKAVRLLTPNIKQPNLTVPGVPIPNRFTFNNLSPFTDKDTTQSTITKMEIETPTPNKEPATEPLFHPVNLLVDGKVVRYVPGMPGPIATEEPVDLAYVSQPPPPPPPPLNKPKPLLLEPPSPVSKEPPIVEPKIEVLKSGDKSPVKINETKKFPRPNSLALKPTTASLKQHHGLTPTMFNQCLISPDTPRVAKKYVQQFLNGNYFSYLGLKSSTRPVYCTLNKTQPFYVPHFKKLSMYSEWRQQDTKTDKLYVSAYDSRQKHQKFTTAGEAPASTVHSSYKFIVSDALSKNEKGDDQQKSNITILGGYECNDDYTYIRGRGRGRYVCDQCGIRCKKPSMLKKHIRTHSNDRPYTCNHCNFSFKTKGNLTKHMKSKAHTKNYAATGSSSSSNQQSATQSSESDTEDSGMDSSDESTRREEHEAAYGLLSLSQKTSQTVLDDRIDDSSNPTPINVMNTEEIAYVSQTNYAKNKILDDKLSYNFINATKNVESSSNGGGGGDTAKETTEEVEKIRKFLGKTSISRPLTYPYTSAMPSEPQKVLSESPEPQAPPPPPPPLPLPPPASVPLLASPKTEVKSIKQFHVIQKYAGIAAAANSPSPKKYPESSPHKVVTLPAPAAVVAPPVLKINDVLISDNNLDLRKRKLEFSDNYHGKVQKNDEVMDLSMSDKVPDRINGSPENYSVAPIRLTTNNTITEQYGDNIYGVTPKPRDLVVTKPTNDLSYYSKNNGNVLVLAPAQGGVGGGGGGRGGGGEGGGGGDTVNINYLIETNRDLSSKSYKPIEYDNSAMETLADIATKQVKLEKNTLAKSVASEFLKIATKNEYPVGEGNRDAGGKEVNELIIKPEGSKSCTICDKSFSKPSQLRLHMNVHYLERPFRCHSCSVSFRTKGHLQKHERSASHHNKLSSSPALASSEPRPFKCVDCNIAFRIHGHLAKHLRSKMHIMKLECLAKIPFGLYAELERSNSLLTEINTADGDQCLESLKTLAKKVFVNDPTKLNQICSTDSLDIDS